VSGEIGRVEQSPRRGQLDRSRRREPRRDRQRAREHAPEPADCHARLLQRPRDRDRVVNPGAARGTHVVEREACPLARGEQGDLDLPVVGRHERDPDLEIDCGGQHEPEVVVRVLADQVHPTRGAGDANRGRVRGCLGGRLGQRSPQAVGDHVGDVDGEVGLLRPAGPGRHDLDRRPRPVAALYRQLAHAALSGTFSPLPVEPEALAAHQSAIPALLEELASGPTVVSTDAPA
jgi:hypothetical protein